MKEHVIQPDHYNHQPIKCYEINQHYLGNIAAVIKYLWRCEYKGDKKQDLEKAAYYIKLELDRMFEFEISEFWCDFWNYGIYFSDNELDFGKNINIALQQIWGGYTKKRLEACLEMINREIELCEKK